MCPISLVARNSPFRYFVTTWGTRCFRLQCVARFDGRPRRPRWQVHEPPCLPSASIRIWVLTYQVDRVLRGNVRRGTEEREAKATCTMWRTSEENNFIPSPTFISHPQTTHYFVSPRRSGGRCTTNGKHWYWPVVLSSPFHYIFFSLVQNPCPSFPLVVVQARSPSRIPDRHHICLQVYPLLGYPFSTPGETKAQVSASLFPCHPRLPHSSKERIERGPKKWEWGMAHTIKLSSNWNHEIIENSRRVLRRRDTWNQKRLLV